MATDGKSFHDFLKSAMGAIPSIFGRLIYMAGLWDTETRCYRPLTTPEAFEPKEVEEAAHHQHMEVFEAWLCLKLEGQVADVAEYFEEHPENRRAILDNWKEQALHVKLAPSAASVVQQDLFRSDLEIVLNMVAWKNL